MPIKIFLIEDHKIGKQSLKVLLEREPDIYVTGSAQDGSIGIELFKKDPADLLLMDIPVMKSLECARLVKKEYPFVKLLSVCASDQENHFKELLEAGVQGCVPRNASPEELLFAIKKIAGDSTYISTEFILHLLPKHKAEQAAPAKAGLQVELSDRENSVLELIAEGFTNMEIANKLFTSVRTIETRRKKLLEKTHTTNTATLIRFAIRSGLVK